MESKLLVTNSLFGSKEDYLMSCTNTGKLRSMMLKSPAFRAKAQLNNMHLMSGLKYTEEYGFPVLKAYNGPVDFTYVPYSERNSLKGNIGVHFFEDDYKFTKATWERLDVTTYKLQNYQVLMCPDHSIFVDVPDVVNMYNVYKSRFAGAYWQHCGYNVIPTLTYGKADSFRYCFDGLPERSIIAVGCLGIDWCSPSQELWTMAMHELVYRLHPTKILVYGEEHPLSGIDVPVIFIKPFVKSKFNHKSNAYVD